jgi:hypothetical protein
MTCGSWQFLAGMAFPSAVRHPAVSLRGAERDLGVAWRGLVQPGVRRAAQVLVEEVPDVGAGDVHGPGSGQAGRLYGMGLPGSFRTSSSGDGQLASPCCETPLLLMSGEPVSSAPDGSENQEPPSREMAAATSILPTRRPAERVAAVMYQRGFKLPLSYQDQCLCAADGCHADLRHGGKVPKVTADTFKRPSDIGSNGDPAVLLPAGRHGTDL